MSEQINKNIEKLKKIFLTIVFLTIFLFSITNFFRLQIIFCHFITFFIIFFSVPRKSNKIMLGLDLENSMLALINELFIKVSVALILNWGLIQTTKFSLVFLNVIDKAFVLPDFFDWVVVFSFFNFFIIKNGLNFFLILNLIKFFKIDKVIGIDIEALKTKAKEKEKEKEQNDIWDFDF